MDEEYQRMAANSIAHEAFCAGQAWQRAAAAQERPCVLWKPRLFRDGNQWCALLGENIQDGVVGFGDSPDAAMWAFDEAWREKLPPAPGAQPAPSVPEDFSREELEAVAAGLDTYEKTVNVGNVTGEGDDHLESTTAYAARFIRAMIAIASEAKP